MPTYDFRCPAGHKFEKFYGKISDSVSELPCPECGQIATRTISGGAGLVFKGSGFYLTDYGKNAHRGGAPESKGSESGGESGGESKAAPEVKPSSQADGSAAPTPAAPEKPAKKTGSGEGSGPSSGPESKAKPKPKAGGE